MVVNERPLKRVKTTVPSRAFDFFNFPGSVIEFSGAFRSNIRCFLDKHAHVRPPPSILSNVFLWQFFFKIDGQESLESSSPSSPPEILTLDVIEEDVQKSKFQYCEQCRVIGWSGHPVSKKRYHFIIRRNSSFGDGYQRWCMSCSQLVLLSDVRCKSCDYELPPVDLQDWVTLQLEDTTHLLHGVVHANGYGHLLRVNGREGGSKFLSGCDIMDFWDRLCRKLRARKISVMDVSKKYGLDFRLLYAISTGHTWYGDWGFKFGTGSFGLTIDSYQKAIEALSEIPLSMFFQSRNPHTYLHDLITFYQTLSECPLTTIRELFNFLMGLIRKTKAPEVPSESKKHGSCSWALCTWTSDDIERVQQSMIKVLQVAGGSRWVSWRALKGATCKLGSPELLEYCLKSLQGKVLDDGRVVHSRCNLQLDAIEYRLLSRTEVNRSDTTQAANFPDKIHMIHDLQRLYEYLLDPTKLSSYRSKETREQACVSARTILDCKQFIKDYESETTVVVNPATLTFSCQVQLIDQPVDYTLPPPEHIFLPTNATMVDLKMEVSKAFQDVYILFHKFQVEEMLGYGELDESCQVKMLIGSSGSIKVLGRILSLQGVECFRRERGVENWTVNCVCGQKDDDGERMVACDVCNIWQHTRCVGINDLNPTPDKFLCGRCKSTKRPGNYCRIGGKTKGKNLGVSKTGSRPPKTGIKCKLMNSGMLQNYYYPEVDSPAESGSSGLSTSKEYPGHYIHHLKTLRPSRFEVKKCKDEVQDDGYDFMTDSPNPSGTTSDETSATVDTCSSKTGFIKPSSGESCNYTDSDLWAPAEMEMASQFHMSVSKQHFV